jgi:hypothetical protein
MLANMGNRLAKTNNKVNDAVQNLTGNRSVEGINRLGNTPDLLAIGTQMLPSLQKSSSTIAARGGFPSNPFSLDNLKNIGQLLLGTIPLTTNLLPDFVADGKIQSYPKNSNLPSTPKTYLVNGIATNDSLRQVMGNETSKALGKKVNLINNSTDGPVLDLLQSAQELVFSVPTKPTQTLSNEIYKNLTQQPPAKMELIGYSQGTIMTTHALSLAITRMKQNGYSDAQIKGLMSANVRVALVGAPVDPNNPAHTIFNIPPGLPGANTKRLSDYFTVQDRLLDGKGEPYVENIRREQGAGELARPNFELVRHDDDLVATAIHDIKVEDLGNLFKNPIDALTKIGKDLFNDVGRSLLDTGNPVGYHMYDVVYLDYLVKNKLVG